MRVLASFSLAAMVACQTVPVPARPDGYWFSNNANSSALVQIDAHYDLMCPDSRASWGTLKTVLPQYSSEALGFKFHTFPLPYHHHSFTAAEGAHVVASSGKDVYDWLEAVFANQEAFGNSATANMTWTAVDGAWGKLAQSSVGIDSATFIAGINSAQFDEDTRVSWKLSCSRGVSGTPTYFVNGARIAADGSWTAAQWTTLLNSLLG